LGVWVRIVITGAAGKLGTEIMGLLSEEGHRVEGVDRLPSKALTAPLHLFDLRDPSGLHDLLDGADAVVHAAAIPLRGGISAEEVIENNVGGTINVAEASRLTGVRVFIYASSIQVIGSEVGRGSGPPQVAYLPLDGRSPANPRGAYAIGKSVEETIVRRLLPLSGISCYSLRFPWLVRGSGGSASGHPLNPWWRGERRVRVEQGFSYLSFGDAARLVRSCIHASLPGYRTYLPALSAVPPSLVPRYLRRYYKRVPLKISPRKLRSLVDISAIERETRWTPLDLPAVASNRKAQV
jgi:nucleoside-diphosphate-sugar epimerase